jgi:hypothetical protein
MAEELRIYRSSRVFNWLESTSTDVNSMLIDFHREGGHIRRKILKWRWPASGDAVCFSYLAHEHPIRVGYEAM